MRTLFARAFVSIWLAMAALGGTWLLIDNARPTPLHAERRENLFAEAVRREGADIWGLARSGPEAEARAVARMQRFEDTTDAAIFIVRQDDTVLGPRPPSRAARQLAATVREGGNRRREKDSAYLIGFPLADGAVGVARVRRRLPWTEQLGLTSIAARLAAIFVLSGLLSLLLARMWTAPLRRLRKTTRRLAEGQLDARVEGEVAAGELTKLARELDTMAERVESLVRGKERLLADVSHELNSPLARLRVALALARRSAGPEAEASLDRIEREAERLGALVEGILASARSDAAGREAVDLVALLRQVVEDARFEQDAVDVTLDASAAVLHVEGDPEGLRRALENVVRNAVAVSGAGARVEVVLTESAEELRVDVRDRGPGVPEEHLEAIFEPLFRLDAGRDHASGGTGLGLAISRRALRAHGGRVEASNREGGGLEVRLTLHRRPPG